MNPIFLLGAIVAGGAVFFFSYWAAVNVAFRRLNPVERAELIRRVSMDTDRRDIKAQGLGLVKTFTGYRGSQGVLVFGWMIALAASYSLGLAADLGLVQALLIALPASLVALLMIARRGMARQRVAFERQLMTSMSLIAAQLEAGGGLKRSFERVVEVVEDPLRAEFLTLLNQVETGSTIVDAFKEMAEVYPIPAMKLFIAALEAEASSPGGKLAPVLRAIADGLERTFELRSEAEAEIAQSRYQFYGIVIGLSAIAFLMYNMGSGETKAAFTSTLGLVVMIPILLNAVWGVIRVRRLFSRTSGDVS